MHAIIPKLFKNQKRYRNHVVSSRIYKSWLFLSRYMTGPFLNQGTGGEGAHIPSKHYLLPLPDLRTFRHPCIQFDAIFIVCIHFLLLWQVTNCPQKSQIWNCSAALNYLSDGKVHFSLSYKNSSWLKSFFWQFSSGSFG